MMGSIRTVVATGTLVIALAALSPVMAAELRVHEQSSTQVTDVGTRRIDRHNRSVRRYPAEVPHYYARPIYYRPYPYGVPYPFVLGFGPWW
jgi:hypothetical protein